MKTPPRSQLDLDVTTPQPQDAPPARDWLLESLPPASQQMLRDTYRYIGKPAPGANRPQG